MTMTTTLLVAEKCLDGRWVCHREGRPEIAVAGPSYMVTIKRFCDAHGLNLLGFSLLEKGPERVVVRLAPVCPDCRGSGRYVGLNVVEDCPSCDGTGTAQRIP